MSEPVKFEFFCSETDFPKYATLLPGAFPPTYIDFVTRANQRIERSMEQVTVEKVTVPYEEFEAYCADRKAVPSYELLVRCTFLAWGRL